MKLLQLFHALVVLEGFVGEGRLTSLTGLQTRAGTYNSRTCASLLKGSSCFGSVMVPCMSTTTIRKSPLGNSNGSPNRV